MYICNLVFLITKGEVSLPQGKVSLPQGKEIHRVAWLTRMYGTGDKGKGRRWWALGSGQQGANGVIITSQQITSLGSCREVSLSTVSTLLAY